MDTLVLRCTLPLLKPLLQRVMRFDVRLIDGGKRRQERWRSARRGIPLRHRPGQATHRFAVSDDGAVPQVGTRFIGDRLGRAEVVPLG